MSCDKLNPCLQSSTLHLSHFVLHLVQIEVQSRVFLPYTKAAHDADIDCRILNLLTQPIEHNDLSCLLDCLAVKCSLGYNDFYEHSNLDLLYHALKVQA